MTNGDTMPFQEYDDFRRRRDCERKKTLFTEFDARVEALRMASRTGDENIHVYDCPYCPWWHIGHDGAGPRSSREPRKKRRKTKPRRRP